MRTSFSHKSLLTAAKLFGIALLPLFLVGCGNAGIADGGVFRSLDVGETWEQKVYVGESADGTVRIDNTVIKRFTQHPTEESVIFALTHNGVYRSNNDGEQWEPLNVSGNAISLVVDYFSENIMYLSTGSQILKSTDNGTEWEVVYQDSQGRQVAHLMMDPVSPTKVIAFLSTSSVLITRDGGEEWSPLSTIPVGNYVRDAERSPTNANLLFAATDDSRVLKSVNGGEEWTDITETLKEQTGASRFMNLQITNNGHIWLGSDRNILKSTDEGNNWTAVSTLLSFDEAISVYEIDPDNAQRIYFINGQTVHRSDNGASTWRTIETFPSVRPITDLLIRKNSNGEILFAGTSEAPDQPNAFFPFLN